MEMHLFTLVAEAFDAHNRVAKKQIDWKKDVIERLKKMQSEDEVKAFIKELKLTKEK